MSVAHPPFFEQLYQWFMTLPHCRALGLEYVAADAGWVLLKLPYSEGIIGDPESGVVHGGAVTTLIDTASGTCIYTLLDQPESVATLDLRIDYLRAAKPDEPILCRAECYRLTGQIAFTRALAYQGEREIAHGVGTFMRTAVGGAA
ncbi:PaaI family thioesterase [Chitiniphilus purpureus]|uniref:PaaI family thioesterase n=1 Tax=Chitiniphilus purpureus TaxID=2981137 RepID=A0ABY6DL25_9NEIS|nr:PaaI family thioesterase [Chitiniphilus sp. CD1]UXY14408.1 PaaI family thioesterase [Chitiniphilus sp. CD1]